MCGPPVPPCHSATHAALPTQRCAERKSSTASSRMAEPPTFPGPAGDRLSPTELRALMPDDLGLLLRWRHAGSPPEVDAALLVAEDAHIRSTYAELLASGAHVYRCIASVSFLHARLPKLPSYQLLRNRFAAVGHSFTVADMGCAFGQDTRELLFLGVSPANVLAADVTDAYWQFGRRVFGDAADGTAERSVGGVTTSFADWAAPPGDNNDVVSPFAGSRDAVVCLFVLHVLSRQQTTHLLTRLARLVKPGGLLVGACVGCSDSEHGGEWGVVPGGKSTTPRWLHSPQSLQAELVACGWTQSVAVSSYDRETVGSLSGHPVGPLAPLQPSMGRQTYLEFSACTPAN